MTDANGHPTPDTGDSAPGSRLAPTAVIADDQAQIRVRGDLDLATSPRVTGAALRALRETRVREVVLDLGLVSFFDASGLGSLVAIRNASHDRGKTLTLTNVPNRVTRLLTLTDLQRHFRVASLDADLDTEPLTASRTRRPGRGGTRGGATPSEIPAEHIERSP